MDSSVSMGHPKKRLNVMRRRPPILPIQNDSKTASVSVHYEHSPASPRLIDLGRVESLILQATCNGKRRLVDGEGADVVTPASGDGVIDVTHNYEFPEDEIQEL